MILLLKNGRLFCNSRYVDTKTGQLEIDQRKVARRYLRAWFCARQAEILDCLPPFYKKLVTQDLYHAQIKRCPLFAKIGQQVIFRLASVLVPWTAGR